MDAGVLKKKKKKIDKVQFHLVCAWWTQVFEVEFIEL